MVSHKSSEPLADQVKETIFENIPDGGELGQRNSDTDGGKTRKDAPLTAGKVFRDRAPRAGAMWFLEQEAGMFDCNEVPIQCKVSRFTRATVRVTFSRREDFGPKQHPDILIFGPKEHLGEKPIEQRREHYGVTGTFGITNPATATVGPDASWDSAFDRTHRMTVSGFAEAADLDEDATSRVTWKLTENEKDHGESLGSIFRTVMVVLRTSDLTLPAEGRFELSLMV